MMKCYLESMSRGISYIKGHKHERSKVVKDVEYM